MPPTKYKEAKMKDLQSIKLQSDEVRNFLLKIHDVSERERYEFQFPLTEDTHGVCSAINFKDHEWEHIMLDLEEQGRCASYTEMSVLKETFWEESEIAIQVHPGKSNYINLRQYALHLWRSKSITNQAEARLKRRISSVYAEVKKYFSGERKEIFLDQLRVLVIFCGEDWLSWDEVCQIKQKYWKPEEAAVQFNVSPELDINKEHMILLWDATDFALPPKEFV